MKLRTVAASIAMAGALAVAGSVQAAPFIVDNFDIDGDVGLTAAEDNTANATGIQVAPNNGTGSIIMNGLPGWNRGNYAFLTSGDRIVTRPCAACNVGELSADSGSVGYGGFFWYSLVPQNIDLSGYDKISFQYAADVPNSDVEVTFSRWDSGIGDYVPIGNVFWGDLADGSTILTISLGGLGLSEVGRINLDIYGNTGTSRSGNDLGLQAAVPGAFLGLDSTIDNFELNQAPEPGTLALLGLGLAGLAATRRRKQ